MQFKRYRAGAVEIDNDAKATDEKSILSQHANFSKHIFSDTGVRTEDLPSCADMPVFLQIILKYLFPNNSDKPAQSLSTEKISKLMRESPKGKATRPHGVQPELYQRAPILWAMPLFSVWNIITYPSETSNCSGALSLSCYKKVDTKNIRTTSGPLLWWTFW